MASIVRISKLRYFWSDSDVKALIAIWGESIVQEELDGAVRNKVFMSSKAWNGTAIN